MSAWNTPIQIEATGEVVKEQKPLTMVEEAPKSKPTPQPKEEPVIVEEEIESTDPSSPKDNIIIIDTGAIINCVKLEKFGITAKFLTTPGVFKEIKSSRSRSLLKSIPFDLKIIEPTKDSMMAVKEYAEKSGDYGAISLTDLEVLALTYQMEVKENGKKNLKPIPKALDLKGLSRAQLTPYSELKEDQEWNKSWGDFDEEDEDDGWVTKENLAKMKMKSMGDRNNWASETKEDKPDMGQTSSHVGCITTDFAMQNTLLTMGLNLISLNGQQIKTIRRWVIRCTACGCVDEDTTREFCPKCGNYATMKRVECIVDEDGKPKLYYNPNHKISLKGTNYRVPLPKGGKKNNDAVLREDMQSRFKTHGGVRKSTRILKQAKGGRGGIVDPFNVDFSFETSFSTATQKGENQWSKKNRYVAGNPNVHKRKYKKSRKGKR